MKVKYPKVYKRFPKDAKEPFVIDGVMYFPKGWYGGTEEINFQSDEEMREYFEEITKNHPDDLRRKAAQFTLECMLEKPSDETVRKWAKEFGYVK